MNKGLVLIVLVVAGAAFGGGYVVGSNAEDRPALDQGLEDTGPSSGTRYEPEGAISVEGPRPELATNQDLSSLRAVVASFPEPAAERGDGSITGTVIAATGEPVRGVEVTALPKRDRGQRSQPDDPDERLLMRLRWQIEDAAWIKANRIATTTGADGSFALEGLQDRAHRVSAKLEGWKIRAKDDQGSRVATPGATIDFTATKRSGLTLEVFLPDGTQPDAASTRLKTSNSSHGGSWRPDRPTIEHKPGAYQLTVTAGKDKEFQAGPIAVEIRAGETTPLRIDLESRPVLTIELKFPAGESTDGGEVYRMRTTSGNTPTAAVLKARGTSGHVHSRRGVVGKLTYPDLKPGSYAVGYTRGGNRGFAVIDVVEVAAGLTAHVLEIPPLEKDAYVVVRVRGPDGELVPDARISTGYFTENSSSSGSSPSVARGEGVFWVLHHAHPWQEDANGTLWVSIAAGGFGTKRVEYEQGFSGSIDIDFEPPATLSVSVKGVSGSSHEGNVHVTLMQGNHHVSNVPCDDEGEALLSGLQPGEFQVQLRVGKDHWLTPVHSEDVRIKSGSNALRLVLPTLYTVTVRGADGHTWLQRQEQEHGASSFHKNAQAVDGEAVFDGLPAGDYIVHSSEGEAKFSVPGASIVVLEKRK